MSQDPIETEEAPEPEPEVPDWAQPVEHGSVAPRATEETA